MRLLTSGGLGDAVMAIGKIYSKKAPKLGNFSLDHIRITDKLSREISNFYTSQKIPHKIIHIPNWDWQKKNRHNYNYFLGTGWSEDNHEDEPSWEINPFPPLEFKKIDGIKLVINPVSGRGGNRKLDFASLKEIVDDDTVFIGKADKDCTNKITTLPGRNLINKTSLFEVIDIICSSETVISPEGFVPYLAAMAGKKVFISHNERAIYKRKHPAWNMKIIKSLSEVS